MAKKSEQVRIGKAVLALCLGFGASYLDFLCVPPEKGEDTRFSLYYPERFQNVKKITVTYPTLL